MMDKYNAQHRKYADHKLAAKNKLHSVKSVIYAAFLQSVTDKTQVDWHYLYESRAIDPTVLVAIILPVVDNQAQGFTAGATL